MTKIEKFAKVILAATLLGIALHFWFFIVIPGLFT